MKVLTTNQICWRICYTSIGVIYITVLSCSFAAAFYGCSIDDNELNAHICNITANWRNFIHRNTSLLDYLPTPLAGGIRFPLAYISYIIWSSIMLINAMLQIFIALPMIDYVLYPLNIVFFILGLAIPLFPWGIALYRNILFCHSPKKRQRDIENNAVSDCQCNSTLYIIFWGWSTYMLILYILHLLIISTGNDGMSEVLPSFNQIYQLVYAQLNFNYLATFFLGLRLGICLDAFCLIFTAYALIYIPIMGIIMMSEALLGVFLVIALPVAVIYLLYVFHNMLKT